MWYIFSLFARRTIITHEDLAYYPTYVVGGVPRLFSTGYFLEMLADVLPQHLFCVLALLFYVRSAASTFSIPLSWPVWLVALCMALAFLNKFSKFLHDRYRAFVHSYGFGMATSIKNTFIITDGIMRLLLGDYDGEGDEDEPVTLGVIVRAISQVLDIHVLRFFWRVGCFLVFDLLKYVALNISVFALVVALYKLVFLLYFELESPLVVPLTASN